MHLIVENYSNYNIAETKYKSFFELPLSNSTIKYYNSYYDNKLKDISFFIKHNNCIICIVRCHLIGGSISCYGSPIEIRFIEGISRECVVQSSKMAIDHLNDIANVNSVHAVRILTSPLVDPVGACNWRCAALGWHAFPHLRTVVDLQQEQARLFAASKQSHRQRIRWAKKNMRIEHFGRHNYDSEALRVYRALHFAAAGRITRNEGTWDEMETWVKQGSGEICLGYLGETAVGGSIMHFTNDKAFYFSAAYDRSLFKYPIGHGIVHAQIERAKSLDLFSYDVGEVYPANTALDEKNLNIGYFNIGFDNSLKSAIVWTKLKND